jgi:hypothetical protein
MTVTPLSPDNQHWVSCQDSLTNYMCPLCGLPHRGERGRAYYCGRCSSINHSQELVPVRQ